VQSRYWSHRALGQRSGAPPADAQVVRPTTDSGANAVTRPLGITLIAVLLACLALGAFVLAMTAETLAPAEARWRLVQVGALICGLTAAVAAVGLWKLRRWGYLAFVGWVAALLAIGLWWPAAFPQLTPPSWLAWVWVALIAAIMLPLGRYIRRTIVRAA
jgi:hypothetical protein